ncbi:MAG: fasciclin domain-containing protein [Cryomorphaceae bacterium]
MNGGNIEFAVENETTVIITDANMNERTVIGADVQGTNGVVHVIDGVLLP